MKIVIYTGNHQNSTSITDTVRFLQAALRDCGHQASISGRIVPGRLHLMLEHFVDAAQLAAMLEGRTQGARYIIVGTEPIAGGTFNGGLVDDHWHYSNAGYWAQRFEGFNIAARMSEAVWVLAESMLAPYSELLPQLPVRFLPHGHVQSDFDSVKHRPDDECDIDFFFSGTMTPHRERLLEPLRRSHAVEIISHVTPEYLRTDLMARAKVCLSLRLSPRNTIPSVSRMHYHLQNRNFLIQERYASSSPLDPFVLHADPGDFIEWARAALDLPNRRAIADGACRAFQEALPMHRILPPLLAEVAALGADLRQHAAAA